MIVVISFFLLNHHRQSLVNGSIGKNCLFVFFSFVKILTVLAGIIPFAVVIVVVDGVLHFNN